MADGGEIVIGVVERANLSATLTAVHRSGFGNVTRVLDPRRGDVSGQLRRAGVEIPAGFAFHDDNRVAMMISAAARAAAATELLRRHGAESICTGTRGAVQAPPLFGDLVARSRTRRPGDPEPLAD